MELDSYRDARNAYLEAFFAYNKDPENLGIAASLEAAKIIFNREIDKINEGLVQKHQAFIKSKA